MFFEISLVKAANYQTRVTQIHTYIQYLYAAPRLQYGQQENRFEIRPSLNNPVGSFYRDAYMRGCRSYRHKGGRTWRHSTTDQALFELYIYGYNWVVLGGCLLG